MPGMYAALGELSSSRPPRGSRGIPRQPRPATHKPAIRRPGTRNPVIPSPVTPHSPGTLPRPATSSPATSPGTRRRSRGTAPEPYGAGAAGFLGGMVVDELLEGDHHGGGNSEHVENNYVENNTDYVDNAPNYDNGGASFDNDGFDNTPSYGDTPAYDNGGYDAGGGGGFDNGGGYDTGNGGGYGSGDRPAVTTTATAATDRRQTPKKPQPHSSLTTPTPTESLETMPEVERPAAAEESRPSASFGSASAAVDGRQHRLQRGGDGVGVHADAPQHLGRRPGTRRRPRPWRRRPRDSACSG